MCIGVVTNVFEAVDVIFLIKGGMYDELNLTVGEALQKRSDVNPFDINLFSPFLINDHEAKSSTIGLPRNIHLFHRRPTRHHF